MEPPLVKIAANASCTLAENPLWHPDQECVYWTDIPAGKIFCFDTSARQYRVIYEGKPVGGFTLQHDGSLLLFRVNDVAHLQLNGRVCSLRQFSEEGMDRFNDVIADPEGRVFAGTFGQHPKCGLYRVDVDGTITKLFSGTGCSNGMGFSPDLKTFYWTCSTTRQIFQFDYSSNSGVISNRRIFYQATENEGIPDGLAVDSEGCIWSARWAGASVVRHGVDGKILDCIRFPATNITSLCFGGENLDQLFVTAAKNYDGECALVTGLFQISLHVRGTNEFRSRIQWKPDSDP